MLLLRRDHCPLSIEYSQPARGYDLAAREACRSQTVQSTQNWIQPVTRPAAQHQFPPPPHRYPALLLLVRVPQVPTLNFLLSLLFTMATQPVRGEKFLLMEHQDPPLESSAGSGLFIHMYIERRTFFYFLWIIQE